MKQSIYPLFGLVALLAMTSCASDDPKAVNSDGKVVVTINLPDFATRAIGDNLECNQLIYTIYDSTGKTKLIGDTPQTAFENGSNSVNVELNLVPGQEYKMVFYAHNTTSEFSSYREGTIFVDYTKIHPNQEIDDAFYFVGNINIDTPNPEVTLKRAFAQINFGTDDLNSPAVENILPDLRTNLSVTSGIYDTFNILSNSVSNKLGQPTLTYNSKEAPAANLEFPALNGEDEDVTYNSLLTAYLLAEPDQNVLDGEFRIVNSSNNSEVQNINLSGMPVCMNFRTNIYGSLLSNDYNIKVTLSSDFLGSLEKGEPVTPENFAEAIQQATDSKVALNLTAGDYSTDGIKFKQGVDYTFTGSGANTNFNIVKIPGAAGSNITLNNMTIVTTSADFQGSFLSASVNYKNCIFTAVTYLYAKKATFTNCTFNSSGNYYPIRTYGCDDLTVTNCTFNAATNAKAILVYGDTKLDSTIVKVTGCKFLTGPGAAASDKGAVEIHTEKFGLSGDGVTPNHNGGIVYISDCEVSNLYGGGLWREVYNLDSEPTTDRFTIYVDGKLVQQGTGSGASNTN